MPHTPEESGKGNDHTGSSSRLTVWWKKFHFSGRLIMCSVLFGLGLVLVGGLIFAINMSDNSTTESKDSAEQLTTKAPFNYVGPVIMGIGGFIVTVGVIMCLFETQVCRKKTGDSSPLISEKVEDPEGKGSETILVPSSSHSHKSSKHGTRKTSASPRKSKSRHAKTHSKEKSQQKSPSLKSPPISIEKSKDFMTSSEDKFLTPPNAIGEDTVLKHTSTRDVEIQSSSSLMKSFTSSGPSLSQSTEFITPSTSFKDSVSINNSVEVDEKQQQVNFKSCDAEFSTPLTVEEDRIQRLFIRVKNEQMEKEKRKKEEEMLDINLSPRSENDATKVSDIQTKIVKDSEMSKNAENNHTDDLVSTTSPNDLKDINQQQNAELSNSVELKENKSSHEENSASDKRFNNDDVHAENLALADKNEVLHEISDADSHINAKENSSIQGSEKPMASSVSDSTPLLVDEDKHDSDHHISEETSDDKINDNDLEHSVSSDETVVTPDITTEKSKDNESSAKENSRDLSKKLTSDLPGDDKSATEHSDSDKQNVPLDIQEEDEAGGHFNHEKNDTKVNKSAETLSADDLS